MDKDYVPAWLITLVALFGCLTAITFVTFLHYHAELASARQEMLRLDNPGSPEGEIQSLRVEEGRLNAQKPQLEQAIALRYAKLAEKAESDAEERRAISTQLITEQTRIVAAIDQSLDNRSSTFNKLLTKMARDRMELHTNEEQLLANERSADEDRLGLRTDIELQSQKLEAIKRENRDVILDLEKQVAERLARVQELLDRRNVKTEEYIADGQIIQARVTDGFVIINRGIQDDISRGMRFVIFNRRGGEVIVKGEAEVIDVKAGMAVARVASESDVNDPIIPGDYIHNSVYNPDETKIYVIKGDFRKFSKPELTRFIEDTGGVVEPEITKKTHYLVAGENASVALEEANLNGVIILSEDKLLAKVRTIDHFQIRRGMTFAIIGDFTTVSRSVVERFVKNNGGLITNQVENGLDVLIAGDNAADAISAARLVGAQVINQSQLGPLMGRAGGR